MDSHAPSTSSPVQPRRRMGPPFEEPPTSNRFCSVADVMQRLRPMNKEIPTPLRFSTMDDVIRRSRPVDAPPRARVARARDTAHDDDVVCDTCGSAERDDELLLCDRCKRGCHTFCLRPMAAKVLSGAWFCSDCAPPANRFKRFPMDESKIVDFFRIHEDNQDGEPSKCVISKEVRRRRKCSLVMQKRRKRILPFVPTEDRHRRLKQLASLATALTSSKAEFSNELTYMPNMAPRSSNQARLEEDGIQVLPKKDKEIIEMCRAMQQRGRCPPLLVVFDPREGFTIQADANIKDMTFIAVFAGDVDYLESRENDDCDCMMTLLLTANPSQNLVICPNKRGNISRFISGINNHTPDGKKKQNVKCVRYDIDGESQVLLVACRDIACGERLYCDYNGQENAYPTHHFL